MEYYNYPNPNNRGPPEPYQPPFFAMAAPAYAAGQYLGNRFSHWWNGGGSGRARSSSRYGKHTYKKKGGNNGVQSRGNYFEKSKKRESRSKYKLQKLANSIERANSARNLMPIQIVSQLDTTNTNLQAYDVNHRAFDYQDLVLIHTASGGGANTKFQVDRCHLEMQITNMGNATAICDVYECLARRNLSSVRSIQEAVTDGFGDAGGSGITVVGMSPYDSPTWTSYFKILNKTREILGAGEIAVINRNYKPSTQINWEEWSPQGSEIIETKGNLTRVFFVLLKGIIVNDSAAPTTQIGTTEAKINIFTIKKYWFYQITDRSMTNITMNTSAGLTAMTTHADIMLQETDAVTAGEIFA